MALKDDRATKHIARRATPLDPERSLHLDKRMSDKSGRRAAHRSLLGLCFDQRRAANENLPFSRGCFAHLWKPSTRHLAFWARCSAAEVYLWRFELVLSCEATICSSLSLSEERCQSFQEKKRSQLSWREEAPRGCWLTSAKLPFSVNKRPMWRATNSHGLLCRRRAAPTNHSLLPSSVFSVLLSSPPINLTFCHVGRWLWWRRRRRVRRVRR